MQNKYVVGNVVSIDGLRITARMNENTNMLTYFYNGETYRGISIGEYVGIIRGPYKLVGKVEKEYLEDNIRDYNNQTYENGRFIRNIELSVIGSFLNGKFEFGIRCFPMIFNEVVLLKDTEIYQIIQGNSISLNKLSFGKSVLEQVDIDLPWEKLFITHIGIFGNTGSGKSNTLTKLYTSLFKEDNVTMHLEPSSKFLFLDFNGEYTGDKTFSAKKKVIKLSTRNNVNNDKIIMSPESFWDIETLSILFSATEKTQRPFLQNAIKYYIGSETNDITKENIISAIGSAFYNTFKGNNNKESLRLLNNALSIVGCTPNSDGIFYDCNGMGYSVPWCNYLWHASSCSYYLGRDYISGKESSEISHNRDELNTILQLPEITARIDSMSVTSKLRLIVYLQLIFGLYCNHIQFDHINPLLLRIESRSKFLDKIIDIGVEPDEATITVISMKDCNQDAKKMIPLLIGKQEYNKHKNKNSVSESLDFTYHLVIDEAHNILSEQSKREEESWKDYRLEVFEEIIKEGRKFGFYLTIASQRPYDISPTIISQLHNYFLHRLVNELDLRMIGNTINSLDNVSKQRIPTLSPGQCIVTGTSFELPLLVQVEKLPKEEAPNSDNADLLKLWGTNREK